MTQETYTVFAKWPDGRECWFPPYGEQQLLNLQQRIGYVVDYIVRGGTAPVGFVPIAWSPLSIEATNRTTMRRALEEALAAGRIIKKVDGRYVARGIPEKKSHDDDRFYKAHAIQAEIERANDAMLLRDNKPRKPLLGQRRSYFDAFPGFTVTSGTNSAKPEQRHPLQSSPDLAVDRIPFGSAHLLKG